MASHEAARRAVDAGYSDVSVMSDGIMGWNQAGKPVAKP
jgi:rhodanese-related sulfurtransferase